MWSGPSSCAWCTWAWTGARGSTESTSGPCPAHGWRCPTGTLHSAGEGQLGTPLVGRGQAGQEQLRLVYLGLDGSEREHREYLRAMPRTWMALPYRDAAFGRELAERFGVSDLPAVVVLAPSGAVLVADAVREIRDSGPSCFQGWRQAAELLDRSFQEPQEQEREGSAPLRSLTEPLRRWKYRIDPQEEEEEAREEGQPE